MSCRNRKNYTKIVLSTVCKVSERLSKAVHWSAIIIEFRFTDNHSLD